jgi:hypothetical protein
LPKQGQNGARSRSIGALELTTADSVDAERDQDA